MFLGDPVGVSSSDLLKTKKERGGRMSEGRDCD